MKNEMINNNIIIEIEMKDTTAMFAVNRMIGYRTLKNDDFESNIQLGQKDNNGRNSIIFHTNLRGMEDVARIINGIEELHLGKEEEENMPEED